MGCFSSALDIIIIRLDVLTVKPEELLLSAGPQVAGFFNGEPNSLHSLSTIERVLKY
jgi:hypothetical protein